MTLFNPHAELHREYGFTIMELLITVTVAAVLAAIAMPNMSIFLQNNARSSRMNELTTAFNIARNEAVSKQTTITVCASATLPGPPYNCNNTNVFETGWIVISDPGALGNVTNQNQVLRITEPGMAGSATFRGTDGLGVGVTQISFDPTGQTRNLSVNGGVRFTYCDARGVNMARAVIITRTGHIKTSRDGPDADAISEVRGVNIAACP